MGLNVYGFQSDFKPHLGHQFKVVISGTNSDAQPDITSQLVKSIKLPEMGMNVEKRNYGTTSLGLSVFTFAEQSIDITFTETESFDVLNTFIACLGWTSNQAINHFYIFVEEYDETMLNLIRKYVYTARVCEVGQPSWQRTGSASFIELTVKFLVLSANISDVSTDNKTPFAVVAQAVSPTMVQQADVIGAATDYGEDYASTTAKLLKAEKAYKDDLIDQYEAQKTKQNEATNKAVQQLQEKYQDPNEKVKKTKEDLEKAKKEQEDAKKELEATKKMYDTFISDETKKERTESLNNTLKALDASGNPLYKGKTLDNMSSTELEAFKNEYINGEANINNDKRFFGDKGKNIDYLKSLIDLKKTEENAAKADEKVMLAEGRVTNAEADLAAYNEERKKVREQGTPKAQSFGASSTTPDSSTTMPVSSSTVEEPSPASSSSSTGTAVPTASSSKAGGTGSGTVYKGATGDRYDIALQGISKHEGNGGYKVYHHSGDVPTIGYGVTAAAMKAGETDFYLKTKSGEIVHINDQQSINNFKAGKYDGATLTNAQGNATKEEQDAIARSMAKNVVKKYEATAKQAAKEVGLDYESLTEAQKGALIDGAYNGKSISKMSAKLMKKKQEGKTVTKEEARQLVDATMTKESQQKFHGGWANRVYDNAMA